MRIGTEYGVAARAMRLVLATNDVLGVTKAAGATWNALREAQVRWTAAGRWSTCHGRSGMTRYLISFDDGAMNHIPDED